MTYAGKTCYDSITFQSRCTGYHLLILFPRRLLIVLWPISLSFLHYHHYSSLITLSDSQSFTNTCHYRTIQINYTAHPYHGSSQHSQVAELVAHICISIHLLNSLALHTNYDTLISVPPTFALSRKRRSSPPTLCAPHHWAASLITLIFRLALIMRWLQTTPPFLRSLVVHPWSRFSGHMKRFRIHTGKQLLRMIVSLSPLISDLTTIFLPIRPWIKGITNYYKQSLYITQLSHYLIHLHVLSDRHIHRLLTTSTLDPSPIVYLRALSRGYRNLSRILTSILPL